MEGGKEIMECGWWKVYGETWMLEGGWYETG